MQATKAGSQGRSCTTLRLSCSPCTWNKYSTPGATGRLQGCSNWHVAGIYKQCQVPSYREMQGGDGTHTERSLPPATVVAKCGGFSPCLALICLIASWWPHGAHMASLVASFLGAASGSPLFLALGSLASCAACAFFVPHGPDFTAGSLQQHKGCSSCSNTAVAGMHLLGGWLVGHALDVAHGRLARLVTLGDAHVTTAAFHAITRPMEACP